MLHKCEKGRCDAEDAAYEIRRNSKNNGLSSKCLNIICGGVLAVDAKTQGGKGLAPYHLEPQQHRAALPPSSPLSNCQTRPLSNFLAFSKKIPRASPPRLRVPLASRASRSQAGRVWRSDFQSLCVRLPRFKSAKVRR